jgi:signal peptidase II
MNKKIMKIDIISYSLILSGIIGNLIDRIIIGKVIDYIDLYIIGYNTPIFNFSDICIVLGGIIILYNLIFKGEEYENINSGSRTK